MGATIALGLIFFAYIIWRVFRGLLKGTWTIGDRANDAYWNHEEIRAAGSHGAHGVQRVREKRAHARLWFWIIVIGALVATGLAMILDT